MSILLDKNLIQVSQSIFAFNALGKNLTTFAPVVIYKSSSAP